MNDKQIAALFMGLLRPAVQASAGLEAVKMARNFQPRQHGANSTPYVYFHKVGDHRHGSPLKKDRIDPDTANMLHEEIQQYVTTYQFSAWIPQDPADTAGLTESDILNAVSGIIQSDAILSAFQAQEVGILRVTDIRNPYIADERDQFEAVPSFDVALTHKRTVVTTIPAVVAQDWNLSRV